MERGKQEEEYSWKRRQSVRKLQGMLKHVGHAPFQPKQEMGGAEATKELHTALCKKEAETFPATPPEPDIFQATPPKSDIFQATPPKLDIFQATPPKHDIFLATPPEHDIFQATPPESDIFLATPPEPDIFQATPPKPDIFQTTPPKHDIFQATSPKHDIFQATPPEPDIFPATPPKPDFFSATPPKPVIFPATPPKPDIFQTTPPKPNIFQTTPPKPDIFSATLPKPVIFPDTPPKPDFFSATPPKPDIFQTTPPKPDIFQTTPPKPVIFPATPPKPVIFPATPPKPDFFSATPPKPDIFPATPPKPVILPATPPKPDIFPATPPKPDIFQATPPKPDIFSGTPPKPDIFSGTPPKPDIFQATPTKSDIFLAPLPKQKENGHINVNGSTSGDFKSAYSKDSTSWDNKECPVYENIFLIGEEKCVEDWPEDSPELCPDWKPPGKLRLRRESLKVNSEMNTAWEKDNLMENHENNSKAKKGRRFTLPVSSRRESKSEAELSEKGADLFKGREGDEDETDATEEVRQKKSRRFTLPVTSRRESKSEAELSEKGADLFKGREGDEDETDSAEEVKQQRQKKGKKFKISFLQRRDSKMSDLPETPPGAACRNYYLSEAAQSEAELSEKGADLFKGREGDEDETDSAEEVKQQRQKKGKKFKIPFLQRRDLKMSDPPETPPGAACRNYYLSEAAQAEWQCAQRDESLLNGGKAEESGVEDGDTDSLMEWWNTVEQWDELPSDEEDVMGEGETKELKGLAEKVQKGIHVFNKVFMEQAEGLWQHISALHAIAENINEFHKKAKIASITGGTTSAVGGVTAIAGLALAPVTMGASLILTAVGIGVATAGGLTSASATISDSVNNSHDRKKVERIVEDYQTKMADIKKCLHFVQQGMEKLLAYNLLKMDAGGLEPGLSRVVQNASEASSTSERAVQVTSQASAMLTSLFQGMDEYYMDTDSRELKKGCKMEFAAQIRNVAEGLHESLVELNSIREELQDTVFTI